MMEIDREHRFYHLGFLFTEINPTGYGDQWDCYAIHDSRTYSPSVGYPGRLAYIFLGEHHVIVHARNRRVAQKKVLKIFRKYNRKFR